jgi:hypothetical protein
VGKGGDKVHISTKSDKTGKIAWEFVDDYNYPFNWEFIRANKKKWNKGEFGSYFLDILMKPVPPGPFTVAIDAGQLVDLKNYMALHKSGRLAIVSVPKNKHSWLWSYLDNELNLYDSVCVGNRDFNAVSYYARSAAAKKTYVHFFTNIEDATKIESIEIYSRTQKKEIDVSAPKILKLYRKYHVFVNAKKNSESRVYYPFRAFRAWRCELNAHEYNVIFACFIWYREVMKLSSTYSFGEFMMNACLQLGAPGSNKKRIDSIRYQIPIRLHKLSIFNLYGGCSVYHQYQYTNEISIL